MREGLRSLERSTPSFRRVRLDISSVERFGPADRVRRRMRPTPNTGRTRLGRSQGRVEALAPEQAQDQLLLCAALQRTFRPPQTLDIIDLQGSYRVSGQNRVRTIANCSGLVVCASRRSPATLALPGHPGAVMCVLARLPQLSLNGALVVWPSAYVLDDRGSLRARRAVPPRK